MLSRHASMHFRMDMGGDTLTSRDINKETEAHGTSALYRAARGQVVDIRNEVKNEG